MLPNGSAGAPSPPGNRRISSGIHGLRPDSPCCVFATCDPPLRHILLPSQDLTMLLIGNMPARAAPTGSACRAVDRATSRCAPATYGAALTAGSADASARRSGWTMAREYAAARAWRRAPRHNSRSRHRLHQLAHLSRARDLPARHLHCINPFFVVSCMAREAMATGAAACRKGPELMEEELCIE